MSDPPPRNRICALCRHLQVESSGREFPGIVDSEYMVFRCAIFGWSTREDYLMDAQPLQKFDRQEAFDCERWQAWSD